MRERAKKAARSHYEDRRRRFVKFATSAEMIQAALNGIFIGFIMVSLGVVSLGVKTFLDSLLLGWFRPRLPGVGVLNLSPPLLVYKVVALGAALRVTWWIRNNTEAFRELVEETTGEEAAEDEPDSETATE